MRIGILQAGHAPDSLLASFGNYADLFHTLLDGQGFTFTTYDVVDMVFPDSVQACDGWLITGSKHGAYEDLPFIPPLEALIRDITTADLPLVGICFGHQIIAQALGGRVEKFAGGWAVGPQSYNWGGQTVTLNAWHQDQVTEKPAGAQVIAGDGFCENAVLLYGKNAFTVQAHPEFNNDFVAGLAAARGKGIVPDPLLDRVAAARGAQVDNALLAERIATFFKERTLS